MTVNLQKLFFYSANAIDRILTPELTVSYPIIAGSPGSPQQDTHTIAHGLGKATYITYAFSVNNDDFYAMGTTIQFLDQAPVINMAGNVWVDASVDTTNVYFYVNNDYNAAVTVYVRYVLDNII